MMAVADRELAIWIRGHHDPEFPDGVLNVGVLYRVIGDVLGADTPTVRTGVVNLAGGLVDRWPTTKNVELLRRSRVEPTKALVEASTRLETRPPLWLHMSTLAIYGDAGHALVLVRTHLDRAILLVVALRDPQTSRRVVEYARRINERIGIVARAHTRDAADYLKKAGANEVVLGEEELAIEMTGYALHRLGVSPQEIALIARGLRAR